MKLSDLKDKYKCDNCGGVFSGNEIKTEKIPDNFSIGMSFLSLIVVSEEGKIFSGFHTEKGDRFLKCPFCDKVHMFGFEKVE